MTTFRAEQFRVGDEVLADLRARIRNTRWPGAAPGAPWEQGTDLGYLRGLLGYWADGFDWRADLHHDPTGQAIVTFRDPDTANGNSSSRPEAGDGRGPQDNLLI